MSAWPQVANTLLGLWLMAAPGVLGYDEPAATNDYISGPIVASLAFIAVWDTTRFLGRANLVIAAWLVVAPAVLGYGTTEAFNSLVVGLLIALMAAIGGSVAASYGGGWPVLWREQR